MVVTRAPVSEYEVDSLAQLKDESAPIRLSLEATRGGWRVESVAA